MRICFFSLLIVLLLSSCSIFPPVKTDNYTSYVINTVPDVTRQSSGHKTLYVSQVAANPFYDTNEMAYSTQPYQVDYFAKNKWSEPPAKMLRPLIIQSLQNTKHFHAVTSTTSSVSYDYILNVKLIELRQLFICKSSFVILKINAEIINARSGKIIASRRFVIRKSVRYLSPFGGVVAINKAVEEMLKELDHFCMKVI